MKIIIYWDEEKTKDLIIKVNSSLNDLWLVDFIKIETSHDENIKKELNITKEPALIVEEEAIDFKDTIFEWIVPDEEELKSMFISIVWWSDSWCAPTDCWTCASWC